MTCKNSLWQKKLPEIMSVNIPSISKDIINNLGEALSLDPDEHRIELIESACNFKLSEVLETCSNIKLTEQERNKLQVRCYFTVFCNINFQSSLVFNYYLSFSLHTLGNMVGCF